MRRPFFHVLNRHWICGHGADTDSERVVADCLDGHCAAIR